MSTEKTEIETFFGRCRCCLTYGYLKNMWVEHEFEGETEIYGEMLVQCFCLSWNQSDGAVEQDQICEQCISRLRDANDFKKVVLDSQEEIVQQFDEDENKSTITDIKDEKDEIKVEDEFEIVYDHDSEVEPVDTTYADTEYTVETLDDDSGKDEAEYEEIEYLDEDDAAGNAVVKEVVDSDSSSLLTEVQSRPARRKKQPIQHDTKDGEPKRKWPKRLPKSERLKTYKQYSEEELRLCLNAVRNYELTPYEASLKYNVPKKTIAAKIRSEQKDFRSDPNSTNNTTTMRFSRSQNKVPQRSTKVRQQNQSNDIKYEIAEDENKSLMMKHKMNLKMILMYSNATIIKSNSVAGYSCWFCDKHFSPANLKEHNMKHKNEFDDAIKVKNVAQLFMKVDITGLKCKLCEDEIDSLEDFMDHLQDEHNKTVYTDIESHIIPFKFDAEELQCVVCSREFKYFKLLSEHMSEHYRNYECTVCRRPFINKHALQTHSYRHKIGEFKCSQCPKVFDTRMKVAEHERLTHKLSNKKRKCGYCSERFSSKDMVKAHETKEHGILYPLFNCNACDKTYSVEKALRVHLRRDHLMIRRFECEDCGKAFFTQREQALHSVFHTKTKDYQCEWCNNAFYTKTALKLHMRAHRSFKCKFCKAACVDMSSLNAHMMKKHRERVNSKNA